MGLLEYQSANADVSYDNARCNKLATLHTDHGFQSTLIGGWVSRPLSPEACPRGVVAGHWILFQSLCECDRGTEAGYVCWRCVVQWKVVGRHGS